MDLSKVKPVSTEPFPFGPMQTKWLKALESGEWRQARRALAEYIYEDETSDKPTGTRYCCLGVMCELAKLEWSDDANNKGFSYNGHATNGYMPAGFAETVGLNFQWGSFKNPVIINGTPTSTLADLNDDLGLSFAEIAAYVRHDPWNVFTHSA